MCVVQPGPCTTHESAVLRNGGPGEAAAQAIDDSAAALTRVQDEETKSRLYNAPAVPAHLEASV